MGHLYSAPFAAPIGGGEGRPYKGEGRPCGAPFAVRGEVRGALFNTSAAKQVSISDISCCVIARLLEVHCRYKIMFA